MSRDCMIFAAGMGRRMGALTTHTPKPLLQVNGRALIDRATGIARDHNCHKIVVNAHYLSDQIYAHFAGTNITISNETTQLLETGGGLVKARPLFDSHTVYTLNSDAIWGRANPLDLLNDAWNDDLMDACLLIGKPGKIETSATRADFALDESGRISRNGDFATGGIYLGAQILRLSALDGYAEQPFSLNEVWDNLIAKDRAFGILYPDAWMDVGTSEGIARAAAFEASS